MSFSSETKLKLLSCHIFWDPALLVQLQVTPITFREIYFYFRLHAGFSDRSYN